MTGAVIADESTRIDSAAAKVAEDTSLRLKGQKVFFSKKNTHLCFCLCVRASTERRERERERARDERERERDERERERERESLRDVCACVRACAYLCVCVYAAICVWHW
jgi:hypothetical protein